MLLAQCQIRCQRIVKRVQRVVSSPLEVSLKTVPATWLPVIREARRGREVVRGKTKVSFRHAWVNQATTPRCRSTVGSETTNSLSVSDRIRSIRGISSRGGRAVLETLWFDSESLLVS